MRVLYLMGKVPLPANSGDAHRNWALLQSARSVATHLDLISLPPPEGPDTQAGLARVQQLCDSVTVVGRPVGVMLGSPINRIRTVAGRPYYHSVGDDPDVRSTVRRRLDAHDYDVIVLSQLFLGSAVPDRYLARTVYDTHNVDHLRLGESLAGKRLLPSAVRDAVIGRVQAQEAHVLSRAAACITCSEVDATALRSIDPCVPIDVIPNGMDIPEQWRDHDPVGPPLFLASLDAGANIEGLKYLVDRVLPVLRSDVSIDVAGSNARPVVERIVRRGGDRVRFLGPVPDARQTMSRAAALLVPLLAGGGTRLKVLEALAVGLPVVSTSKGVEGIPVVDGRHALVADTPSGFATAVTRVLDDPELARGVAKQGRVLVESQFDWAALGERFAQLLTRVGSRDHPYR